MLRHKKIVQNRSEVTFVDIGAHVGSHGMMAAALGYSVVFVDPLKENHLRIHKAARLNQFENRVTLMPYAMMDDYREVRLRQELHKSR